MYTSSLNQNATYWAVTGVDVSGDPTYDSPTKIKCRWENIAEIIYNDMGEEIKVSASVFVSFDALVGSYLYLGISEETDPTDQSESREVKGFSKVPDLSGCDFERRALLLSMSQPMGFRSSERRI